MDRQTVINSVEGYLSKTQGFIALKKARARINENPQIKGMITSFQEKQNALYSQKLSQAQAQQAMDELNEQYETLSRVPLLKDYFQATDQFNSVVNQFMKDINAAIERNLDTP